MTINAGSWNPIDHSDDRITGFGLGSKSTKKNKDKISPKEQQKDIPKNKSWFQRFLGVFR